MSSRIVVAVLLVVALVVGYLAFDRTGGSATAAAPEPVSAGANASSALESTPEESMTRVEAREASPVLDDALLAEFDTSTEPASTWPATLLTISPENWTKQHEGASRSLLEAEAKRIQDYIVKTSEPEFDKRLNAGQAIYIASGNSYDGKDWDPLEVRRVYMAQNTISKIVLPKDEFPDLYNLNAKMRWCQDAAQDTKRPQN